MNSMKLQHLANLLNMLMIYFHGNEDQLTGNQKQTQITNQILLIHITTPNQLTHVAMYRDWETIGRAHV